MRFEPSSTCSTSSFLSLSDLGPVFFALSDSYGSRETVGLNPALIPVIIPLTVDMFEPAITLLPPEPAAPIGARPPFAIYAAMRAVLIALTESGFTSDAFLGATLTLLAAAADLSTGSSGISILFFLYHAF